MDQDNAQEVRAMAEQLAQYQLAATEAALEQQIAGVETKAVLTQVLDPLKRAYEAIDHAANEHYAEVRTSGGVLPACAPGCSACCRLMVEVNPLEAFMIADYLQTTWEHKDLDQVLIPRLKHAVAELRTTPGSRIRQDLCAFITPDERCGVYAVRPSVCRTFFSPKRQACEAYADSGLDGQSPEVLHGPFSLIYLALHVGSLIALSSVPFPDTELTPFYELQSAVLCVLETPQALERYLDGEDIFVDCERCESLEELKQFSQLVQLSVP
jgi:Fe-S-cluster containining protein